jgi:arylsulfatase
LLPWLKGITQAVHAPGSAIGWELFGRRAIRQDTWKAVYVPDEEGVSQWQLYDLAHDLGEIDDRADDEPEKLEHLLALWRRYVEETGVIESPLSIFDTNPDVWGSLKMPERRG